MLREEWFYPLVKMTSFSDNLSCWQAKERVEAEVLFANDLNYLI